MTVAGVTHFLGCFRKTLEFYSRPQKKALRHDGKVE